MEINSFIEILKTGIPVATSALELIKKIGKSWKPKNKDDQGDLQNLVELLEKNIKVQEAQMETARSLNKLFPFLEKATILRSQFDKMYEISVMSVEPDEGYWKNQRLNISQLAQIDAALLSPIENDTFPFPSDKIKKELKSAVTKLRSCHTRITTFLDNPTQMGQYQILLNEIKSAALFIEQPLKFHFEGLMQAIGYGE